MIILLKNQANPKQVENLEMWLRSMGFNIHKSVGESQTIMGLIGDTSRLDIDVIKSLEIVENVQRVQEPYKNANRKFHAEDTVVTVNDSVKIGGGHFEISAGPCSVETEEQIVYVAKRVKAAGAKLLRGGAFKPRTSPYAFQGLHEEGIRLLLLAKQETGLPIVTEIMDVNHLPLFEDVDVIQVTLKELLMSAEYIMAGGNDNVILCERGIRTFETATRNTLDLAAVPVLRKLTHLPVIVDPSHATGYSYLVKPMAMAAAVAGADGLMIEVHNDPPHALSDGAQSLTPEAFDDVAKCVFEVQKFACRSVGK